MMVTGSPPPYKAFPRSLKDKSSCSVLTSRSLPTRLEARQRSNFTAGFRNNAERKRPKSNREKTMRAIECAFRDKVMNFKLIQPGYLMIKRRSGVNVVLNMDEFLDGAKKVGKKTSLVERDERDVKIKSLYHENEELKASLAEERMSNSLQFQEFVENTKVDIQVMLQEHRDHIQSIQEDHDEEMDKLRMMYEAKIERHKEEADSATARLQEEICSVKETLQSCKEDVTADMELKWSERQKELEVELKKKTGDLLEKQSMKFKTEQLTAVDELTLLHIREMDEAKEAHRKEINALLKEFSLCAADAENFKLATVEIEKLKARLTGLQDLLTKTKEKLRKTTNELVDAKVKLQGYELSFSEKVAEVEERYSMKIQGLMLNNTDIRRNYMKKCAELLDVQTKSDSTEERKLSSTRSTMKTIILARTKADVSLVSKGQKNITQKSTLARSPLSRPRSAPARIKERPSVGGSMFLTIAELRAFRPSSSLT